MLKFKALEIATKKVWTVVRFDFGDSGDLKFIWCRGKSDGILVEGTCGEPDKFELKQFLGEIDKNGVEVYEDIQK